MTCRASRGEGFGIALVAVAGLSFSIDMPLVKLTGGEVWSVLAVRSSLVLVAGIVLLAFAGGPRFIRTLEWPGIEAGVALLYGLNALFLVLAVFNAPVANIAFILGLSPAAAALLAWWWLGERPSGTTMTGIVLAIAGVALILVGSIGDGTLTGHICALAMVMVFALGSSATRRYDLKVGPLPLCGFGAPAAIAWVVVSQVGFEPGQVSWLAIDALLVIPLAYMAMANAPRYVPAAFSSFALPIELALVPIWMWLVFSEVPERGAVIGGSLVMIAVVLTMSGRLLARARPPARGAA